MTHEEHFMSRASKPQEGCWEWTGCKNRLGYGMARFNRKMRQAHRISYEIHHGEIGDMHVLHRCDNPACINPEHLFLGTNAQNMADRNRKGRQARGSAQGLSKLSENDVAAIRQSDDNGKSLAARYHVSNSTISRIRAGKTWTHVHNT